MENIQVLGPYNSGTNLLVNMLSSNLNKDINLTNEGSTIVWKHIINKSKLRTIIDKNPNTLFIVVYKPLLNWIKSMIKRKYMLIWDKTIYNECEFKNRKFNNIAHLYNSYYRMYRKFCKRFPNTIFVSYYDLIKKDTVLQYINEKINKFNLFVKNIDGFYNALEQPSKKMSGKPVSNWREALLKKNENPFNNEEIFFINKEENQNVRYFFTN